MRTGCSYEKSLRGAHCGNSYQCNGTGDGRYGERAVGLSRVQPGDRLSWRGCGSWLSWARRARLRLRSAPGIRGLCRLRRRLRRIRRWIRWQRRLRRIRRRLWWLRRLRRRLWWLWGRLAAAATQAMVDTLATAVTQDTAVDTLATAVELAEPRLLSPWLLSPQSGVAAPEGFSRGSESYASGHRAALHCFTKPRSNWVSRNMRAFAA